MKHYILYLFLFLTATLYGQDMQFRMSSNGIISWTVLTDSTYSATINLNSDQTGGSFNGTHVVDTFRLFTDAQAVYTVDSVMSALLSTVTIRVKEYGSTNGTPTGQVLIYNPLGGTAIPSVPVGNSGATPKMDAAIVSYNSKVSGGSIASVNGDTGPTVVLDPDDLDDAGTTHKFTDAAAITKLGLIEDGATADQTPAEIETAYNTVVDQVSGGEKTAGTETEVRRFSPKDVADMAGTHGSAAGDSTLWANVRSYGAAGDGSDATTALEAAIATGKPVYLPQGRYLTTRQLTLNQGQAIFGVGNESVILTTQDSFIVRATIRNKISDIRFVGTGKASGDTNQHGVFIDGGGSYDQARENTIASCSFDSLGGAGIHVRRMVDDWNGNLISSCYATECSIGYDYDTRGEYNQTTNSHAINCTTGFRVKGGNNNFTGCLATSCTTGFTLINGDNDAHGVASGCTFNHNTTNVSVVSPSKSFTFVGCMLYVGNITLTSCENIKFIGCDISTGVITESAVTNSFFLNCTFISGVTRSGSGASYVNNIGSGLFDSGNIPVSDGVYSLSVASGVYEYIENESSSTTQYSTTFTFDGLDTLLVSDTTQIFRTNVGSVTRDTLNVSGSTVGKFLWHITGVTDSIVIDFEPDVNGPSGGAVDTVVIYNDGFYDFYFDGTSYYFNIPANEFVAGFDPAAIPNLTLWLDADDAATVTTSGAEVINWADKSGNGNDFTGIPGTAPTVNSSAQNGLNVIDFDGTEYMTDSLSTGVYNALHNNTGGTIFFVIKCADVANPGSVFSVMGNNVASTSAGRIGFGVLYDDRPGVPANESFIMRVGNNINAVIDDQQNNQAPTNTFGLISIVTDPSNATASNRLTVKKNTGSNLANNAATNSPTSSDATYSMQIGSRGDSGAPGVIEIAELLIYSRQLSSSEMTEISNYLNSKWSLY